jgi:hypothetical protein
LAKNNFYFVRHNSFFLIFLILLLYLKKVEVLHQWCNTFNRSHMANGSFVIIVFVKYEYTSKFNEITSPSLLSFYLLAFFLFFHHSHQLLFVHFIIHNEIFLNISKESIQWWFMLERNLLMNIPWVFNYDYSACIEWPEPRNSSLYVQRINTLIALFYRSWEEEREEKKSSPPFIEFWLSIRF